MKLVLIVAFCLFCFREKPVDEIQEEADLKSHFDSHGLEGCFVMLDPENRLHVYNPERSGKGYIPKSTFKIPHALIALEEDIIADEHQVIRWDGTKYGFQAWNQDQTLSSAIKYSCVWFFSAIAEKIDGSTYIKYMEKFGYGNSNISGPPSRFWLFGDLRISAVEQVDFLKRFYLHQLGISDRAIDLVKKLILVEKTDDYRIYAKTGGGPLDDNVYIMWYVGFVEKEDKVFYFAMNFTCDDYTDETTGARTSITSAALKELGVIR